VGMLRGVYLPLALLVILIVIGAVVSVPMLALVGRLGVTQRTWNAAAWVKKLQTVVWKSRIGAHLRSLPVDRWVPGIELADLTDGAGFNIDANAPVRPVGGDNLARIPRIPGLVDDPLLFLLVALVGQAVSTAVTVDDPDAAVKRPGVAQERVVCGMEFWVANGSTLQDDRLFSGVRIDNNEAMHCPDLDRNRPVAVVMAQRCGTMAAPTIPASRPARAPKSDICSARQSSVPARHAPEPAV
jgi:hypothetical protein